VHCQEITSFTRQGYGCMWMLRNKTQVIDELFLLWSYLLPCGRIWFLSFLWLDGWRNQRRNVRGTVSCLAISNLWRPVRYEPNRVVFLEWISQLFLVL
jgi:hypothetical protein